MSAVPPTSVMPVLVDFARTGSVGPVRCGDQLPALTEILGPPWATGTSFGHDGLPYLYAYGNLEIGTCQFFCRRIESIHLQTGWAECEFELPLPGWGHVRSLSERLTYRRVVDTLEAAGCRWEESAPLTFDDQRTIRVVDSQVQFGFAIPEEGEPTLSIASVAPPAHRCGPAAPA
ncbi:MULTISPECIES: hypothetical protein [Streptomyces]|uniref:Uncharacterized protein n=3 Tax=Streptomyces rimosus TaxID=1927 RepID=L8ET73_STRR1|nr:MULTISPECIES: hypothetical protein [Streptomyces]MYT43547.1 hypothetical protein [Streptomyces sp. SID5471]KEF09076.1 hypothetical protein DF17_01725 [Streptomyces rimosus]KUJ34611.1 hypothetical protein ADK46_17770 [Streptomyces rimosus subsp. rimosus]QDA03307.1 hypothetical protein CTZ40_05690 [Streptomyces rimosus]QEV74586.1 hypothetical protein CP984_05680 [Streptomyces rimosus]